MTKKYQREPDARIYAAPLRYVKAPVSSGSIGRIERGKKQ